jgi:hypothetical protein
MKVRSLFVIHLGCGNQVELVYRYLAVALTIDIERGTGKNVVANLLGRAAILEDDGHFILAGRGL